MTATRSSAALGAAVSALLLAGLLWVVDPRELAQTVAGARAPWVAATWTCMAAALACKVQRWGAVLRATRHDAPSGLLADAFFTGYLANYTLPGRVGELGRAALYSLRSGLPLGASLTTIAVDRALDAAVLAGLLLLGLEVLGVPEDVPGWVRTTTRTGLAAAGIATVGLAALSRALPESAAGDGWRGRLLALGVAIREGLGLLRRPPLLAEALFWTAAAWALECAAVGCGLASFGISVPASALTLAVALTSFAAAAPAAPGSLGVHQWVTVLVLAPYGVLDSPAAATSLMMTACTISICVPRGAFGLWRQGSSWGELRAWGSGRGTQARP